MSPGHFDPSGISGMNEEEVAEMMTYGSQDQNQPQTSSEYRKLAADLQELKNKIKALLNIFGGSEKASLLTKELNKAFKHAQELEKAWEYRLEDSEQEFLEVIEEHEARFVELRDQAEKLQQQLQELLLPPFQYMVYVRFAQWHEGEDGQRTPIVDIMDSHGELLRVPMNSELDPSDLKYGQRVRCSRTKSGMVVMEASDEFVQIGEESFVLRVIEEKGQLLRAEVEGGQIERKRVVNVAQSVDTNLLEEGKRVLVNTNANLLVEILPDEDSKQFLVEEIPDVAFDDIGGLKEQKELVLEDLTWPKKYVKEYEMLGLDKPKGLILYGPPGTGKTMIAKAIANKLAEDMGKENAYFYHSGGPELQDKYVGETERKMRQLFARAKKKSVDENVVVVIFFDEVDALLPVRGSGISSDVEKTNVAQFTSLMDGLDDRGNVFVIGATNRIDMIDPAATRPGRFDAQIRIPNPDEGAAKDIFSKYLKNASWEILDPKYNVDVYTPTETDPNTEEEAPRTDEKGNRLVYKFNHNAENVMEYFIERAVERMYDKNERKNEFVKVKFQGEHTFTTYRYGDFVSGALIKNIVDRAKKKALRGKANGKTEGIALNLGQIYEAIDDAYNEMRIPSTLGEMIKWFLMQDKATSGIVEFSIVERDDEDETPVHKYDPTQDTNEEEDSEPEL